MLCHMSRKRRFEERCFGGLVAVVAAGLVVLQPAIQGQEPDNVTIDVSDCVALEKPGERLDCFERQLEAQRRAAPATNSTAPARAAPAPAAPAPTTPASPAPTAAARETARTAISAPDAVEEIRGRRGREEPAGREIVAVVTELRETVPNTWTITLDNGQVWRQSPPKWYPLRTGAQVRLYPTTWGTSYRLTVAETKGFIQVERVR
jgi:hypothetical protein